MVPLFRDETKVCRELPPSAASQLPISSSVTRGARRLRQKHSLLTAALSAIYVYRRPSRAQLITLPSAGIGLLENRAGVILLQHHVLLNIPARPQLAIMTDDRQYQATIKAHGAGAKRRSQAADAVTRRISTSNVLVLRCRREEHREWQTYTLRNVDIITRTLLRNWLDRLSFSDNASYVYNDGLANPVVTVDEIMDILRTKTVLGDGTETMLDIVVFDRDPTEKPAIATPAPRRTTSSSSGRQKKTRKKRRCSVQ